MFVSCTSLQKVYENLSKIVVLNAFVSLASAKLGQEIILTKYFKGKFLEKLIFEGILGRKKGEMRGGDDKRKKKGERGKEKDAPRHCRSEENEKERREMSEGDGGKDREAELREKGGKEK